MDKLVNDQEMPRVNSLTELQKVFLQAPAAAGAGGGEDWEKVILTLFEGTLHEKLMAPLKEVIFINVTRRKGARKRHH